MLYIHTYTCYIEFQSYNQPSPNEKSTTSLISLFKEKICRIVCHPLPAPLPPTTVGDVTPLPVPQLCLFNVLSLSEFVSCEYVLDLVRLDLRLTEKAYQRHPDPKNDTSTHMSVGELANLVKLLGKRGLPEDLQSPSRASPADCDSLTILLESPASLTACV